MSRIAANADLKRLRHLEGVLDISGEQAARWSKFCGAVDDAMRLSHQAGVRGSIETAYPSLPLAVDLEFRHNLVRLEACRTLHGRVWDLYAVLTEKQRVLADRLLAPVLLAAMESAAPAPLAA